MDGAEMSYGGMEDPGMGLGGMAGLGNYNLLEILE